MSSKDQAQIQGVVAGKVNLILDLDKLFRKDMAMFKPFKGREF